MDDVTKLSEAGIVAILLAILIAVGFFLWNAWRFVARKLFDDTGGYVPKLVQAHTTFLDHLDNTTSKLTDIQEEQASSLRDLRDLYTDSSSHISNIKTHQALWYVAAIAEAAADEVDDPTRKSLLKEHAQAMRSVIAGMPTKDPRE